MRRLVSNLEMSNKDIIHEEDTATQVLPQQQDSTIVTRPRRDIQMLT